MASETDNNTAGKKVDYNEVASLLFDKTFRNKIRNDSAKYIESLSYNKDPNIKYVIKTSSKQIFYVVLPSILSDDDISKIQAAGQSIGVSTFSSAGTAGTISTVTGSTGTISSAACAGSAGSKGV